MQTVIAGTPLQDKTETTFKMVVTSKSGRRIQLEKCLFLKENAAMTLSDDSGCTSLTEPQPVMIEPCNIILNLLISQHV